MLETDKIDKISRKFSDDLKSAKLHSPKFKDIVFFNVWKSMAVSSNPLKADAEYWKKTDLINHDFAPEIRLNPLKKIFSKIMFFIMKRVIK